jgi:hypothetical protein
MPDAHRAGQVERISAPPAPFEDELVTQVTFVDLSYVTPEQFGRYAGELTALSDEHTWSLRAARPVSSLHGYEVARLLLERILPSLRLERAGRSAGKV